MRMHCAPHLPPAISSQVLQCQWFAQSTWGTRRACAGAAPFTHGADDDAQSQKVNVVSGLLSGPCAIHMGPPPDPHRTAPRPPPDTDATDLHEAWDCKRNGARTSCPLWASNVHRSPRVVGGHPKRTGCPRAGSSARLRPFVHPEPVRAWPNAALVLITTSVWQAIHASLSPAVAAPMSPNPKPYTGKGLAPAYLRCEYLIDPLGIDERAPRLSWVVESGERGQRQTAWRVDRKSTRL